MSTIWHKITLDSPCIPCLGRPKLFITVRLAEDSCIIDKRWEAASYPSIFEKAEEVIEKRSALAKRKEVSRASQLVLMTSLSTFPSLLENKSSSQDLLPQDGHSKFTLRTTVQFLPRRAYLAAEQLLCQPSVNSVVVDNASTGKVLQQAVVAQKKAFWRAGNVLVFSIYGKFQVPEMHVAFSKCESHSHLNGLRTAQKRCPAWDAGVEILPPYWLDFRSFLDWSVEWQEFGTSWGGARLAQHTECSKQRVKSVGLGYLGPEGSLRVIYRKL